jgi:hypothetical protein
VGATVTLRRDLLRHLDQLGDGKGLFAWAQEEGLLP